MSLISDVVSSLIGDNEQNSYNNELSLQQQNRDYLFSKISNLIDEEKYDQAIAEADRLQTFDIVDGLYFSAKAMCLKAISFNLSDEKERLQHDELINDALSNIDLCRNYFDSDDESIIMTIDDILLAKGWILTHQSNSAARRCFILAMLSDDSVTRQSAIDGYQQSTQHILSIVNTFTRLEDDINEIKAENSLSQEEKTEMIEWTKQFADECRFVSKEPFSDRQFLFIVSDVYHIAGCVDDNIKWTFTLQDIPAELTFPIGHPQANTLYMAHPVKEGYYLPYEKAEQTIFHEKVNEFIRLSQCLGATKISFRWKHGEQIEGCFNNTLNAQLSGGKKHIAQASAQYLDTTQETFVNRKHEGIAKQLTFDPMQKPYVPEDVLWLNSDTSWQTFVKQRMEGNALHYTIQISSSESSSCSASRKQSIKASFENLIANVDVNFNTAQDSTFKNDYDTVWELDVDFRSLKEFENTRDTSATQLNAIEQAFVDEIQFCLEEDANISDTDRKYLERKRVKLGLSPERAEELINTCAPSLSSEEQEYLDTFHELVDDVNDISPKMRKMLDREADSLGISEKRKMELEKM